MFKGFIGWADHSFRLLFPLLGRWNVNWYSGILYWKLSMFKWWLYKYWTVTWRIIFQVAHCFNLLSVWNISLAGQLYCCVIVTFKASLFWNNPAAPVLAEQCKLPFLASVWSLKPASSVLHHVYCIMCNCYHLAVVYTGGISNSVLVFNIASSGH